MSREQVKTIRLEHKQGALFDYSVKGKEVDHIRFSQAERSGAQRSLCDRAVC